MPSQPITIDTTTPLNVKTQAINDVYSQQLLEKMLLVLLDMRDALVILVQSDKKASESGGDSPPTSITL